jgi:hypothetical protein
MKNEKGHSELNDILKPIPNTTHLQFDQLIGSLPQQLLADVVEGRDPDMSRVVHDTQAQDVTVSPSASPLLST